MSLDIYFSDDIRNALLAADEATASMAEFAARLRLDPQLVGAYMEGYRAALDTMALAFGLLPIAVIQRQRETQRDILAAFEILRE